MKYRYDPDKDQMVEVTPQKRRSKSPTIIPDIEPYQTVGPEYGTWITSRSRHREYLRRHNLIEVGNERKSFD